MEASKDVFCKQLGQLLANTREEVKEVKYEARDYMEYAVITFDDGYKREANITGDSNIAIITDVIKAINE